MCCRQLTGRFLKIKKDIDARSISFFRFGVPTGIRTPVAAVKGQCPRPLDDGDKTGALGAIRTPDPLVRSQILYPTELQVRLVVVLQIKRGRIMPTIDATVKQKSFFI